MRALTGGLVGDCGEYPHYMPCTIVRVVELVKMHADRLTQQKRANQGFGIRGQGVLGFGPASTGSNKGGDVAVKGVY